MFSLYGSRSGNPDFGCMRLKKLFLAVTPNPEDPNFLGVHGPARLRALSEVYYAPHVRQNTIAVLLCTYMEANKTCWPGLATTWAKNSGNLLQKTLSIAELTRYLTR